MFNTCVIAERVLEEFGYLHAGINPSKVSCIKSFLLFMGQGHTRLSDWEFLDDLPRIRA